MCIYGEAYEQACRDAVRNAPVIMGYTEVLRYEVVMLLDFPRESIIVREISFSIFFGAIDSIVKNTIWKDCV